MAKPIRFTPKNSDSGWRINIPAKISETGKRQQLFYRTQKLALAAADDLKKKVEIFGVQTRAIAPTLAEQATAAAALLKPYGIGLLEAARIVAAMRERILAMRRSLHEVLSAKRPGRDFGYFLSQRGMFSYTGLSAAQVDRLRDEFGVYLVRSGRVCVAGLNSGNVERTAQAMAAVI